jgi:hypothetical protein
MRSVGRAKQANSNCALKHHWRGLNPQIQCSLHGKEDCEQYFVIVRDAQILGGGKSSLRIFLNTEKGNGPDWARTSDPALIKRML